MSPPPEAPPIPLPLWAPAIPWFALFLLELPAQVWLWDFGGSKVGPLGFVLALGAYAVVGVIAAILALVLEPLVHALATRRGKHPLDAIAWQFLWAGTVAWGVVAGGLLIGQRTGLAGPVPTLLGGLAGYAVTSALLGVLLADDEGRARFGSSIASSPRKTLLATAFFALCLGVGANAERIAAERPGEPKPPNILLVTIGAVNRDRVSAYGYAQPTTPTLARLAAEGIRFDHAYTHVPATGPSHATIFAGLLPQGTAVFDNSQGLPMRITTLADQLRLNRYFTIGVPSSEALASRNGWAQGFDRYPERSGEHGIRSLAWMRLFPARYLHHIWGWNPQGSSIRDNARFANQHALEAIDDAGTRPWFCWVHYADPQAPYVAPEEDRLQHREPFDPTSDHNSPGQLLNISYNALSEIFGPCALEERGVSPLVIAPVEASDLLYGYDAELHYTDRMLGELLEMLEARGALDQTLVVVAADHGEGLMEEGYFGSNFTLAQAEVQVPLVIWWPGKLDPRVIPEPVGLSDLAPTILNLVQVPVPDSWLNAPEALRGTDLGPWLRKPGEAREHPPIYLQQLLYSRAMVTADGQRIIYSALPEEVAEAALPYTGLMWQWYDLHQDPHEWTNLALTRDDDPRLAALKSELSEWASAIEGTGLVEINYPRYLPGGGRHARLPATTPGPHPEHACQQEPILTPEAVAESQEFAGQ